MRLTQCLGGVLLLLVFVTGCNTLGRQPRLEEAQISPATLKPGDSAVITVKVKDKYEIVGDVVGVVIEDQRKKFKLLDDGQPPDVEAGDGIWSLMVDVPFLAPPGQFTLEFTAYNSRGNVVLVETKKGTAPLKQTCAVTIEYPPEEGKPAPPQAPGAPQPSPVQSPEK